jgi:ornithine carbamoyltransferase
MRHIIALKEQTKEDIIQILDMAKRIKEKSKAGELTNYLPNKTLVMLFQKTSTRTRLSFETAMTELGGHAIFMDSRTSQFSLTDFGDEIRAVMRFGDILTFRALKSDDVKLAASFNRVPVIDACSDKYHPAQALGDIMTMSEHSEGLENVKNVAWLGIENNVSNSLMMACTKLGINFNMATPQADKDSVDPELNEIVENTGLMKRSFDIGTAMQDVDYVHTTRDAIDHKNSIIFDQAENRLHVQKAMILWVLGINL